MTKKIVITGTHLTPAIELINQLKEDSIDWEIFYIGRKYNSHENKTPSIESQTIPKLGIKFYGFQSGKFDRRWLPNTIAGIPLTIKSLFSIFQLIKILKPNIVVSFGGYISVPVIINSYLLKIPSITHEQTSTISLSTKINSLFASKVALSFPINTTNPKFIVTGNLLRRQIFENNSDYFSKLKIDLPILFIMGGNQGSAIINQTISKIIPNLTKKFFVIHQTGQYDYAKAKNYLPLTYIDSNDYGWVINHADVIVSRAGANSCQEIIALQKKSILIPLKVSQQNEQLKNAKIVNEKLPHQTVIIPELKLNPEILYKSIEKLFKIINKVYIKPNINYSLLKLIKSI